MGLPTLSFTPVETEESKWSRDFGPIYALCCRRSKVVFSICRHIYCFHNEYCK